MKKIFTIFLLFNFVINLSINFAFSADMVDDSIDSVIKSKYNTKKIEEDLLPPLPNVYPAFEEEDAFSPSTTPSPVKAQPQPIPPLNSGSSPQKQQPAKATVKTSSTTSVPITLNKGKKFKVAIKGAISDKTPAGTQLSFVTLYPETFTYVTIPAGTVFRGKVVDSHPPNLTGNGGLIVIGVYQVVYKGKAYDVDTKISIADGKRVFFDNIKGKRKFMKNMWSATEPGHSFFKKMWKTTCTLARNENGADIILAPFSLLLGTLVYGVNIAASPFLALFTKGDSLSIPSGAKFVIQLTKDTIL